ncbi:MAG TPA: YicC family protein [Clostridia bacterium]|nr:YicC family protein [Clostridia bacterium]
MNSMTGYGKGTASLDGREFTVELKSVNHRCLDLSMRFPRNVAAAEDVVRGVLKKRFARGHIDVYAGYTNCRSDSVTISCDSELLAAYVRAAREANKTLSLSDDLTLSRAIALPDVFEIVRGEDDEQAVMQLAAKAAELASDALAAMRRVEGDNLKAVIEGYLNEVESVVNRLELRAPQVVEEYKVKLSERITKLLDGVEADPSRLAMEVAVFADRASVDEELCRMRSHISQFQNELGGNEPCGKKLDTLVQEMFRETNTTGSKSFDADMTAAVLENKALLEKIREQVQNLE